MTGTILNIRVLVHGRHVFSPATGIMKPLDRTEAFEQSLALVPQIREFFFYSPGDRRLMQ